MKTLAILVAFIAAPASADSFVLWQQDQWTVEYVDGDEPFCAVSDVDVTSNIQFSITATEEDIYTFMLEVQAGPGAQTVIDMTTRTPRYLNHIVTIDGQSWQLDIDYAYWGARSGRIIVGSIGLSNEFMTELTNGYSLVVTDGWFFDLAGSREAMSQLDDCRGKLGTW